MTEENKQILANLVDVIEHVDHDVRLNLAAYLLAAHLATTNNSLIGMDCYAAIPGVAGPTRVTLAVTTKDDARPTLLAAIELLKAHSGRVATGDGSAGATATVNMLVNAAKEGRPL